MQNWKNKEKHDAHLPLEKMLTSHYALFKGSLVSQMKQEGNETKWEGNQKRKKK
jgi:hypothetical protein